jgi:phosphoribosylaminoimidazole-succinocarboxamide synthase
VKEQPVIYTDFSNVERVARGKVRDIYKANDNLLIVTTDRISAYDVVMQEGIPGKGKVLTNISVFWFRQMTDIVANHLLSTDVDEFPEAFHQYRNQLADRSMLVKKASPIPIECVVRGYLAGSGWKEYQQSGTVCGIPLPGGLQNSDRLPEPIFTPATKATEGHDENISFERAGEIVGEELITRLRDLSIAIYKRAASVAEKQGIIIADTKMEFGVFNNDIILIDELLTPDSSRFWPMDDYQPGRSQKSFDKQFLRDYLESLDWNKQPPPPPLPEDIIRKTAEKYQEALRLFVPGERYEEK